MSFGISLKVPVFKPNDPDSHRDGHELIAKKLVYELA